MCFFLTCNVFRYNNSVETTTQAWFASRRATGINALYRLSYNLFRLNSSALTSLACEKVRYEGDVMTEQKRTSRGSSDTSVSKIPIEDLSNRHCRVELYRRLLELNAPALVTWSLKFRKKSEEVRHRTTGGKTDVHAVHKGAADASARIRARYDKTLAMTVETPKPARTSNVLRPSQQPGIHHFIKLSVARIIREKMRTSKECPHKTNWGINLSWSSEVRCSRNRNGSFGFVCFPQLSSNAEKVFSVKYIYCSCLYSKVMVSLLVMIKLSERINKKTD